MSDHSFDSPDPGIRDTTAREGVPRSWPPFSIDRKLNIKTERLRLHPLEAADLEALHQLWTAPGVRRYLWDDRTVSLEETREIIDICGRYFEELGFGIWGITAIDDGALIGFAGFWFFRDPPELELVIGLAPEHWGKGFATEAGNALIPFAFLMLGFEEINASTDAANAASIRLMERLKMEFDRRAVTDGLDTLFYRISK